MLSLVLFAVALAQAPAPLTLDLDGDGKPETVRSEEGAVRIGSAKVACEGDVTLCEIYAHDISSADKQREVAVCAHGPRDERYCRLFTLRNGQPTQIPFADGTEPGALTTSGNGIVLTSTWAHRLYDRVEKYVLRDGALHKTRQPLYAASATVKVDRTFPLLYAPDAGSTEVVGNVRADSEVQVIAEHGERPGWLLLRLSSGITGWVEVDTLIRASDHYTLVMSAG